MASIHLQFEERVKAACILRDESLEAEALLDINEIRQLPSDVIPIVRSSGKLTDWELEITEKYDATDLLKLLSTQKIKATSLLHAFRKRATIAHQVTNCLTELLPEAIEAARASDEYIERTGKTIGPLHGLPISLKEQIGVTGHKTNGSFVAWVDNVTQKEANIITSLKHLGAIIFARTNQPQAFMQLETSNNIYGETVNPRNRSLTAGGSSGGEAALMAMYGSPLGIGGDMGGSIRSPASQNGLWGFKSSTGRVSGLGVVNPWPGCDSIKGTLGPFTRSLRDIELFYRSYSTTRPWVEDVELFPGSITAALASPLGRPLRVGFMIDDGIMSPLPPVRLIVEDVRKKLTNSPLIQLRPFKALHHDKAWSIYAGNLLEDGGAKIKEVCKVSGEPLLPLTDWALGECEAREKILSTVHQDRKAARDAFRQLYSDHWNEAAVDVVIAPITPSVAPPLNTSRYWSYTAVWNLLDYPAVAFPASEIIGGYSKNLKDEIYIPKTPIEQYFYKHYDPEVGQKVPVGLQVIGKRLHDSETLAAMNIVEQALMT